MQAGSAEAVAARILDALAAGLAAAARHLGSRAGVVHEPAAAATPKIDSDGSTTTRGEPRCAECGGETVTRQPAGSQRRISGVAHARTCSHDVRNGGDGKASDLPRPVELAPPSVTLKPASAASPASSNGRASDDQGRYADRVRKNLASYEAARVSAWNEGKSAREIGRAEGDNPYAKYDRGQGAGKAKAWRHGWNGEPLPAAKSVPVEAVAT